MKQDQNKPSASTRIEQDTMGELAVPVEAYYGVQTARAIENFPISSLRMPRGVIRAMGMIKRAAATVNHSLGLLDKQPAEAIKLAATEVVDGKLDAEFPVDIFQTGSGTSTNMNTNEVISNRATELLGGARGSKLVHPNDHVNLGQSSNDVIPTAIHIAASEMMQQQLLPALTRLNKALKRKAKEFDQIVKIGRTHLQDATPVRLGQEFGGYARQIELGIQRVTQAQAALSEVALGGTAVGTGLNCHPQFSKKVMAVISKETGCSFKEAKNHFEAQSAQDSLVEASGCLRTLAVSLMKIANDIRWLGSGPRCGLGEINLPETQPGSSIMPGKVNPVIAESVTMVCAQVIGNDVTVTVGGQAANFELIVMMPVMAYNLLQSIELLATASDNFSAKCIEGIKANEERCKSLIEESLAMCTALAPEIGYEAAAKLAKDAYKSGKTVRQVAKDQKVLPDKRLAQLLDPWRMTEPGGPVGSAGG
ncbi:class II fumarate hydratase [Candidatus Nitrospira nitrificans]|uniref:Fumarate hydratase class II n=1 Tax=Candidatus Nitrospira nitrificans TaxID=1742973 RepID=A0A0S4L1A3_9BACT|nr:class II fumarate hydratase [Candidatus Nitrospira nitrificans]CUS31303.1 fumarate hydratase (fumarase C),aerobic Class II [Candidatus Nitrospira nitrificans]